MLLLVSLPELLLPRASLQESENSFFDSLQVRFMYKVYRSLNPDQRCNAICVPVDKRNIKVKLTRIRASSMQQFF